MAQGLGLSAKQFESLEAGDWQALPGAAFVRSVLFAYARRLGIDQRDMVEQLLPEDYRHRIADLHADIDDRRIKPKGLLGFAHGGSGSVFAWFCLILASAVVLVHFFGRQ
jgi:cytoskeletal protein RodZ